MAQMAKYTKSAVYGLTVHNERRKGCSLSNKDIDRNRSHLNYNLAQSIQPLSSEEFVTKRVNEVKHINRKDIIQMVDWIITLPKNVPSEDEQKFFKHSFEFVCERYGKKNIVSGWVHNDETTPHIHISFVPVRIVDGVEKLDCKNIMTKPELKDFHPSLEKYLEQHLGYLPEILNDSTINGNRAIKELKAQEDLSLRKGLSNVKKNIEVSNEIIKSSSEIDFETTNLLEKVKSLSKANTIIDELKHSNKLLNNDVKTLKEVVKVQKEEIDLYRNMPLAKQLRNKEIEINNLNESITSLQNEIEDNEFDLNRINKANQNMTNKIEKLEHELFIHNSFLEMIGLKEAYSRFKTIFNRRNFELNITDLINICNKSINSIKNMINVLINRIHFLKEKNVDNTEIVYRGKNKLEDMTRGG